MPLFGRRKSTTDNGDDEESQILFIIERVRRVSPTLQRPSPRPTARFHSDEIVVGEILAQGEFNTVFAIQELRLSAATMNENINRNEEEERRRTVRSTGEQLVVKMATTPKRARRKKKQLRELHELAAATLVLEAQYLARLQHPGILQLRGIPLGESSYSQFFFLTERIVETLGERMELWRQEEPQGEIKLDTTSLLFQSKMKIANDIASALHYLQRQHRIVLLNLSPETIGFLQDGTVKLFDLGHCREIPPESKPEKKHSRDDEASISMHDLSVMFGSSSSMEVPVTITTKATSETEAQEGIADTGSHRKMLPTAPLGVVPRYLAPEILTTGQCNLKSDSYSFAVILYELFTLQKPYAAFQPGQHMIKVCIQGKRPNLHLYHFPKALESLLHKGWRHNWGKRISVSTMHQVLANVEFSRSSDKQQQQPPPTTRGMPPSAMVGSKPRRGRRPERNRSMMSGQQKSLTSRLSLRRNKSLMESFRRSKTPVPLARVSVSNNRE